MDAVTPNPDDGKPGRRPKLTDQRYKAAIKLLRRGNFRHAVARRIGVGPSTFRRWLQDGRKFPDGLYGRFRADVLKAEAYAETNAVRTILEDGHAVDARHLEWFLERKYPQRWGRFRGELGLLKRKIAELEKLLAEDDPPDREVEATA